MKLMPLALIAICLPALAPAQNVLLRYKFKQGAVYRYKMSMVIDTKTQVSGSTNTAMPMKSGSAVSFSQTIKSVDRSGTATMVAKIESLNTTINGKPFGSPQMPQPTTMKMTPTGKVDFDLSKVQGMSGLMSPNAMQGMQMSNILPEGPVHVGSKWTSEMNMGPMGTTRMSNTLQKLTTSGGSQIASIRVRGTMDAGEITKMFKQGMTSGMKMGGTITYDINVLFNVTQGWLQGETGTTTFNIKMNMANQGGGKPMNMHMTGNQSMKISKV